MARLTACARTTRVGHAAETTLTPVPPNLLLIVMDTARRDSFEPYGALPGSTPSIAQMASRGIAHEHLFAASSWTLPSHASMFTGLLPRACGVSGRPGIRPHDARPQLTRLSDRMLAEVLRRKGYATAAASANLWITPSAGFDVGFDHFAVVDSARQSGLHRQGPVARLKWSAEGLRAKGDDGAREIEALLSAWIGSAERDQAFFWFVNLVECHSPYLPPRPYDDLGPLDRIRAAEEARRHLNLLAIWRACSGGFDIPDAALDRMRHLYARSIRYMDDWLARLLQRLNDQSLLEDTLVVVTSDHGENLGEGALISHALSLDNRLLRVPLVAVGPGCERLGGNGPASLASLPRMVCQALGIDRHPWIEDPVPEGIVVAQLEASVDLNDPQTRPIVDEWGVGEEGLVRLTSPQVCATDGLSKLLRIGDREVVFDLIADPLELAPMTETGPDPRIARLRATLDRLPTSRTPSAGRITAGTDPSPDEVAAIEERMRLLGYL